MAIIVLFESSFHKYTHLATFALLPTLFYHNLLFPILFDCNDVSNYEIKFERIPENYISRLYMPLVCFISYCTAKTTLATLAFLCCGEIVKTLLIK